MAIDISDLSPSAQKQAAAKYFAQLKADEEKKAQALEKIKQNKYRNIKTEMNDIKFDSRKEAKRYLDLMAMLKAGEIKDLRLQYEITIKPSYKTPDGTLVRAVRYKADFYYLKKYDLANKTVGWFPEYEDVKGKRTKEYMIKKKMLADIGIYIKEI